MESNWRYNIWDLGLWGSGWELAARIILDVGPPAWLLGTGQIGTFAIADFVGPNQPPTITHVGTSPFPFPNQIAAPVEPDN